MPSYTPPLRDMQFLLNELLQVPQALKELPAHSETDADTITAVLEEGGKRIDVQLEPNAEIAASELAARLLAQGFRLARLQPEEISLETAFMRLTKGLVS